MAAVAEVKQRRGLIERLKHFVGERYGVNPGGAFTVPINNGDSETLAPSLRRSLENAHKNPIVASVVTWLVNQGSTTPLMMRRTPDEEETQVFQRHDLLSLLRSPSEFLSGRELLAVSERDMLVRGQTFWHKDRIRSGQIDGLTFLPAGLVEVKGSRERLISQYLYKPGGNQVPIPYEPEEIVHIRIEPDPLDPKNGLPPLVALARALMIEDQAEDYTSTFLTEVGTAGGFLTPPSDIVLTEDVAKATRDYIQKEFKGSKRGTLGVLRAAMNFIRTAIDPKSVGTHDTHNMVVELICAVYGVHPVIVGLGAGNAQSRVGAATKELERAAWTNRVIPLQDTIAEQIGRQLLPEFVPEDEIEEWEVTWNRSNVMSLQPDLFREAQRWALNFRSGIASRYDAKRGQNLDATDADKFYLLPTNVVPIPEGTPPPPPAPPPTEEPAPEPEPDREQPPTDDDDGEERSMSARIIADLGRSKADLDGEQRTLLLALAADADTLFERFSDELTDAFEELGSLAVEAFWVAEGGDSVRSMGAGPRIKQEIDEDEVADEVRRILRALAIRQWEQAALIPAWDGHTLRTLNLTVGTVNSTLGLQVNIPDPTARRLLAEGGTRRGLIDFDRQTREALFRALFEGRSNGEGPIALARRIREQVPAGPFANAGSKYRAELIARTETANAQNISAVATYQEAGVFAGLLISDGDYDEECAAMDGRRVSFEEFETIGPTAHPNCTRSVAPVREL